MVVAITSAAQLRPLQTSWNSLRASTQLMSIFSSRCFRVKAPLSRVVPILSFEKHKEYSFRRMRFCVRAGSDLNKKLKREGGGIEEEDKKLQEVRVDKQQIQALDNMGSSASGELHLIVGPMFAGKTTALIHRMRTEIQMGRNVVLVKSNKDTRYGLSSVVSHDGAKMPCWAAADLTSFKAKLGEEAYRKLDVIGIDEAQFFIDLYSFCQVAADRDAKTVIVAGLDGDYLRKSFGSALDLIPLADSVTKLQSRCEMCGRPASFTLRKTGERKTEVIGGADVYMPVCRQHYVNGQIVVDATRTMLESQQVQCDVHVVKAVGWTLFINSKAVKLGVPSRDVYDYKFKGHPLIVTSST